MRMSLPMGSGLAGTIGRGGLWWYLGSVLGYVALSIWAGELTSNWSLTVTRDILRELKPKLAGVQGEKAMMIDWDAWRRRPAAGMMLMKSAP